jgi:hypothetical protein
MKMMEFAHKNNPFNARSFLLMCLLLFVSESMFASNSDDVTNKFKLDLSVSNLDYICKDKDFLNKSKIRKSNCHNKLTQHAAYCDELILPMIPAVDSAEDKVTKFNKVKSLSELHIMCIKYLVYEEAWNQSKN